MKHPVIGFISSSPPSDRKASSGTAHAIAQQLKGMGTLYWIPAPRSRYYRIMELVAKVLSRLFRKNISFGNTTLGAKTLASGIKSDLFDKCDILVAFFTGSKLGYVDLKGKPLIYLSDATFSAMINYYPPFCRLWKWNIHQGIVLEKKAMDKSNAIVLSSKWSADSAVCDLKQSPEKIHMIEFGANISDKDIKSRKFKFDGMLNLLFLGVEWERKGGDIAVETTKWLNENGIPTQLHIVGIKSLDDKIKNLPFVQDIGFLNKNNKTEYNRLIDEIYHCHALILPTHAECSAIAFAEASAYGLPTFTFQTGGIPNYIENGRNGYMLAMNSTSEDYGRLIAQCLKDGRLERMTNSAKEVYLEKLNWNVWAKKMNNLITDLTDK